MPPASQYTTRRLAFRALHTQGCFLLPNPWDIGGAQRLQKLGFQALASSSSACALALGRTDYHITLEESLAHLQMLVGATELPVNADFENGFADAPERVAENVSAAVRTGIAGISIEDQTGGALYGLTLAVERIAAARAALVASGEDVMLVARCEAYLVGRRDPKLVTERLMQFAAAGADCLFAPGVTDLTELAVMVRAVAPRPVNVLLINPAMRVSELAAVGVRRVSLGSALAQAAWQGFDFAASTILNEGRLPAKI